MFVNIRGINPGHRFSVRAGRFFPTDQTLRIEVVDSESDPFLEDGKPDPLRIGRRSFELIKADKGSFSIMSDDDTARAGADATIEEARVAVEKARDEVETLRKENADLRARIRDLQDELANLAGEEEDEEEEPAAPKASAQSKPAEGTKKGK